MEMNNQENKALSKESPKNTRTPGLLTRYWLWGELTRNLAVRDVETRYKHSLLGLYWAIINPLVNAGIYGFVFGVIFHASSKPIPYVVFLLTGLTFWNLFANGMMSATGSVSGNAALLAKIYFPRIVLPTASVLARLIDFMFSALVLTIFIAIYHVPVHWQLVWIPLILLIQVFFTIGIGYMVAALNVLYRDVNQLIGLVLMAWFYFSPVMYRLSGVPKAFQPLILLNPMGATLEAERNLLYSGHLHHPHYLDLAIGVTVLVVFLGYRLFKRIEPLFAEVM